MVVGILLAALIAWLVLRRAVGIRGRHVELDRPGSGVDAVAGGQQPSALDDPTRAADRHDASGRGMTRSGAVVDRSADRLQHLRALQTRPVGPPRLVGRDETLQVGAEEIDEGLPGGLEPGLGTRSRQADDHVAYLCRDLPGCTGGEGDLDLRPVEDGGQPLPGLELILGEGLRVVRRADRQLATVSELELGELELQPLRALDPDGAVARFEPGLGRGARRHDGPGNRGRLGARPCGGDQAEKQSDERRNAGFLGHGGHLRSPRRPPAPSSRRPAVSAIRRGFGAPAGPRGRSTGLDPARRRDV